ncbi:uncharacterized protein LOC126995900 [Eriocheir sinensis]|uniref:uncharacterized protein LOC126995900 n=1 Tax=Eriocheir sinensis TaxID=95602 RepID=UPI0021C99856|nr:uncharacterized protein LOC126995900 [Eriocheir sinensis]
MQSKPCGRRETLLAMAPNSETSSLRLALYNLFWNSLDQTQRLPRSTRWTAWATEECGGLDKTEDCSTTTTRPCTRRPWMDIIKKCSGEEEGPEVSSPTSGQAYDFSAVNNVPEGRFSF